MKIKFKVLIILGSIFLVILIAAGVFVLNLDIKARRIGDCSLDIKNNQDNVVSLNKEYSIATYNIGFGAYDQEFSFFMDEGYDENGNIIKGKYGMGRSYNDVLENTNGSIDLLKEINADFILAQEVDTKSTRSYKINQLNLLTSKFNDFSYSYAINFHSGFLPYPFNDMHGKVNSGILSLSRFNINKANRIELPIDFSFPTKFFDLDRCLSITRYSVLDKELVIINAHLSAYDKGGVYRKAQLDLLNDLINKEYSHNNYVIVGGDFNHDLVNSYQRKLFKTNQGRPDWLKDFPINELNDNFKLYACDASPSCRDADTPYVKDETFTSVVDGFIVSKNVSVSSVKTINNEFKYSDHNPVVLKFKLE